MNKFVTHGTNETHTENGQLSYKSTLNSCLDLFYKINASRGIDLSDCFEEAYNEDPTTALAVLLYSRDIRGGQGERQQFRDIVKGNIDIISTEHQLSLIKAVAEVGRFDDLKVFIEKGDKVVSEAAVKFWADQISSGNYLAAKWCPSTSKKGAAPIRKALGFKLDKDWRKYLSSICKSSTIENVVCNTKDYASVDYSKLPSKAMNRWKNNFKNNDADHFDDYLEKLTNGETKVNASVLYPYEVYKDIKTCGSKDRSLKEAQWKALPKFGENDENILPVLDRSGSMSWDHPFMTMQPAVIANSLALYCSERNTGAFHNIIMSFASNPSLTKVDGDSLYKRDRNLDNVEVGYSTDFRAVFDEILRIGKQYKVPQEDMPSKLLVVSDMQFNSGYHWNYSESIMDHAKHAYEVAGYKLPQIVFWQVAQRAGGIPITCDQSGTAIISGFSPVILKQVLGDDLSPISVMNKTVLVDRYNIANY